MTHLQTGDGSIRKPANTTPALGRSHQPATGAPLWVMSGYELDHSTFTVIPPRHEPTSSPHTLDQGRREHFPTLTYMLKQDDNTAVI